MDEALIAYTAGIVDGEGSIQINASRSSNRSKKRYWGLTVQVSSVGEGFLESLRDEWGMGRCTYSKSRGSKKNRVVCNWRLYSRFAEEFLKRILPHLRLKKAQAEVALEFRRHVGFKRGKLTDEISSERLRLAMRMRELNAKTGKCAANPIVSGR